MSDYSLPRSASCPELTMYHPESPNIVRRRAYSEVNQPMDIDSSASTTLTMTRVQSDTDLRRINRHKTFEGSDALFDSGNILARVVSALGSIRPSAEEADGQSVLDMAAMMGRHGFSDSQILSSERSWSHWSLSQSDHSNPAAAVRQRARAASVFQTAPSHDNYVDKSAEWTWNGTNNNAHIQEFLQKTRRRQKSSKISKHRSISIQIPDDDRQPTDAVNNTLLQRINPFKKRAASIAATIGKRFSISAAPNQQHPSSSLDPQSYLERTARGRDSRVSLPKQQYLAATERRRPSVFSILSTTDAVNNDVLETTTIADLIRALELVHTKVADGPDDLLDTPKRKMGTAGITPTKNSPSPFQFPSGAGRSSFRRPSMPRHMHQANMTRRQSSFVTADDALHFSGGAHHLHQQHRRLSIRPPSMNLAPPPYFAATQLQSSDAPPKQFKRRFSVRPTKLSIPPGQAPPPSSTGAAATSSSSMLQRRLSLRPSPLARGTVAQQSGRFQRLQNQSTMTPPPTTANRLQVPGVSVTAPPSAAAAKNPLWRPAQLYQSRTRHGSLSELFEKNERKRTESK